MFKERPKVGQIVTVYNKDMKARIIRVYDFGTIDVESLDGKRRWRITGLPFL